MKIGIDIDDVLCEFFQGYIDFAKEKIGNRNISNVTHEHIWEVFNITREEALKIADDFSFSNEFSKIKLVEGSKEGVSHLNKTHNIQFITSRPPYLETITKNFLLSNYEIKSPIVFFAGNVRGGSKLKHEICIDNGVNLMIEDSPGNSLGCAKRGVKVILLNRPWNQNVEHENIFRVNGWKEAIELINYGKL